MLIGTIVAVITLLVGFLSGRTMGLADQNVSDVTGVRADRIVFSAATDNETLSYAGSAVTGTDADAWRTRPGVDQVNPCGINQLRLGAGDKQTSVPLFGAVAGFGDTPSRAGHLTLSETAAADLGVTSGDTVDLAGSAFTVDSITADSWYSHTPVVWLPLTDWQNMAAASGRPGIFASVLAVNGDSTDFAAADRVVGMSFTGVLESLVVGAFFTVWNIQRQPDVAVLKALCASSRLLVVVALGQERGSSILELIVRLTIEHATATVPVTHDQRLLPLMDSVQIMVNGTLTMSRQSVTA